LVFRVWKNPERYGSRKPIYLKPSIRTQGHCHCQKWSFFLKERTSDPLAGKWFYTHKRLRSAYRSLKINLPYLFTYQKYLKLNIPNTTNSLDGCFAYLKELVRVHRGINKTLKRKIIQEILTK
jgi:hypothetical protein